MGSYAREKSGRKYPSRTIEPPKTSGWRTPSIAEHQPPKEYPSVAHDVRTVCTAKWSTTQVGMSWASHVSSCGPAPLGAFTHSVSSAVGLLIWGMTTTDGASWCAA